MAYAVGQMVADLRRRAEAASSGTAVVAADTASSRSAEGASSAAAVVAADTASSMCETTTELRASTGRVSCLVPYDSDSSDENFDFDINVPSPDVHNLMSDLLSTVTRLEGQGSPYGGEPLVTVGHFSRRRAHSSSPRSFVAVRDSESPSALTKLVRTQSTDSLFVSRPRPPDVSQRSRDDVTLGNAAQMDSSVEEGTANFTTASPSRSPRSILTIWEVPINDSSDEDEAVDAAQLQKATLAISTTLESDSLEFDESVDDGDGFVGACTAVASSVALTDSPTGTAVVLNACYVPLTLLSAEDVARAVSVEDSASQVAFIATSPSPSVSASTSQAIGVETTSTVTPDDDTSPTRPVSSAEVPSCRPSREKKRRPPRLVSGRTRESVGKEDEQALVSSRRSGGLAAASSPTRSVKKPTRTKKSSHGSPLPAKTAGSSARRVKASASRPLRSSSGASRTSASASKTRHADTSPVSAKSRKRKRAISSSSSSSSETESSDDDEDPVERVVESRPKGDRETRARDNVWANPSSIFPDADLAESDPESCSGKKRSKATEELARQRAKSIPQACVPPSDLDDRRRPPLTKRAITAIVEVFVATTRATLYLSEYQHRERLEIVRQLLPIVYSGQHQVEPMLRFLWQNGHGSNDPLVMLATALRAELIDTRQSTQASSAPLTVFNYLVPLLMQRWALMVAGVAAQVQWRGLGLMYNNWNWFGRWPELLIVDPVAVERMIKEIYAEQPNAPASDCQTRLGKKFIHNEEALAKWCYVRRCSRAVQGDKTGKSIYMDLIVPPLSVWLRLLSSRTVAIALGKAEEAALPANPSERVVYPELTVYESALTTLTRLLAGSNVNVVYGRLVQETLARATVSRPVDEWVTYDGADPAILASVARMRNNAPALISSSTVVHDDVPMLAVRCQWSANSCDPNANLNFLFPLPATLQSETNTVMPNNAQRPAALEATRQPTSPPRDGAESSSETAHSAVSPPPKRPRRPSSTATALAPSTMPPPTAVSRVSRLRSKSSRTSTTGSAAAIAQLPLGPPTTAPVFAKPTTAVCITGVRGRVSEKLLRQVLSCTGPLRSLWCDEAGGEIWFSFVDASNTIPAIMSIYGTTTRAQHIRAIEVSGDALDVAWLAGKLTPSSADDREKDNTRYFDFPAEVSTGELTTSLLLARCVNSIPGPCKELLAIAASVNEQLLQSTECAPTVVETGKRLVALEDAPYDFFAARLEHCALFEDSAACSADVYLFLLREVVLEHLQLNAADSVYVTPPEWLGDISKLEQAIDSPPLYDALGESVNVAQSRALLCPIFLQGRPLLVFFAFPKALDVFGAHVTPPFIWVFGTTLSTAMLSKLLTFLFFRLETLLQSPSALTRCKVACIKLTRPEMWNGEDMFNSFLEFAHAARVSLKLLSTIESLAFSREFFTDEDLLAASRLRIRTLIQTADGNPQLTDIVNDDRNSLLIEWRNLAAVSRRRPSTDCNGKLECAVYSDYVAKRYLRVNTPNLWTSTKEKPSTNLITRGYELIQTELQQGGHDALRAYAARLQQLRRRGFYILGCRDSTIELCRRATEHVTITFPEFFIRLQDRIYSAADEMAPTLTGWSSSPDSSY